MRPDTEAPDPLFLAFQQALAGRYSIDRELGRGGMGVVYLAREVHLDRPVAIKLLPPERAAQPGLRDRFLGEARLAAKLSHPNIIPIHAVEERDGFVFYVMAFIDGQSLAERVRERGPLSASEGARVLREVAWALSHAHGQGLVHRDVKPDNILLESSTGRVLVADFGIAAAMGDAAHGAIAGTPEFMSPEQALGGAVDGRSDLYALGVTGYYAFSARLPFEGGSATEILARQVTEAAPPLHSLGLTVPRKLALLIDRCLAKEADQRPASAEVLAGQLGLALEQRRELPAALRAFVKRRGRIDGPGTLIAGVLIVLGSGLAEGMLQGRAGIWFLAIVAPGFPFLYLVRAARQLLLSGFSQRDLLPAFQSEIDQSREEFATNHRGLAASDRPLLNLASKVAAITALFLFSLMLLIPSLVVFPLAMGAVFSAAAAVLFTMIRLAILQRTRDADTEFWAALWRGRVGRAAFAVASRLLGRRRRITAMTHRATELSLGMAAEQLFESLPRASRQALLEIPAVLQNLQANAQQLRGQHDELQEALSALGSDADSAQHADLRSLRDQTRERLTQAVGGLEMIRLNLLRLHAGSVSVAGFTTQLSAAGEMSSRVERLADAHHEVDGLFDLPRPVALTPV